MEANKLTKEQIEKELQLAIKDGVTIEARDLCDLPSIKELKSIADNTITKVVVYRNVNTDENYYSYLVTFYDLAYGCVANYWTQDIHVSEDEIKNISGGIIESYRSNITLKKVRPSRTNQFRENT